MSCRSQDTLVPWWLVLLEGIASLVIGGYLLFRPAETTIILVQLLGIYWLFTGIFTLVALVMDRTDALWKLFSGLIGVLAGIAVLSAPLISALIVPTTMVLIIAILGICFGFISLFWSLKLGIGHAIAGVLSIIFGAAIIVAPVIGILMLVYLIGILSVIGGLGAVAMAFKMKS
jgi:uncharacterized membrane protein HdeD (DUF308 family)